jgi:flagellar protein FliO/FliZ
VPIHDLALAVASLSGVLGLIWLIQRGLRLGGVARFRPGPATGRLRVVQSLPIDSRRRLVLLACDDREVLVLTGGPTDVPLGLVGGGKP